MSNFIEDLYDKAKYVTDQETALGNRVLSEIGLTSPAERLPARLAEAGLGVGIVYAGSLTTRLGIGVPIQVVGMALMMDGVNGAADDGFEILDQKLDQLDKALERMK